MHTFYSIIIVVIGVYGSVLLNYWITKKGAFSSSFFSMNLADAMNPIITLLLTVAIAYFINIKFVKTSKINDLFLELLNEYKLLIDDIEKTFSDYIEFKNEMYSESYTEGSDHINKITSLKAFERKLKNNLKKGSMKLDTLSKVHEVGIENNILNINGFHASLRILKQKITDDPFGQSKKFNTSTLNVVSVSFEGLKREVFLEKIKLFK